MVSELGQDSKKWRGENIARGEANYNLRRVGNSSTTERGNFLAQGNTTVATG